MKSLKQMFCKAKLHLKEIMDNLYKTTILSPMDGYVTKLNVELGERVFGAGFQHGYRYNDRFRFKKY